MERIKVRSFNKLFSFENSFFMSEMSQRVISQAMSAAVSGFSSKVRFRIRIKIGISVRVRLRVSGTFFPG